MNLIKTPKIKIGWPLFLTGLALLGLWKLSVVAVKHPRTSGSILGALGLWWALATLAAEIGWLLAWGSLVGLVALFLAILAGGGWLSTVDRWVRPRVTNRSRRSLRYAPRWRRAMKTAGLVQLDQGEELVPRLKGVSADGLVDRIRVGMLEGQTAEDYGKVAERLAQTFGVREVRVRAVRGRPHDLDLLVMKRDPLAGTVRPPELESARLDAIEVGVREDGLPFRLRLLYAHLLIAGVTGSGKGSVIWSLLLGLKPAIEDGMVRVLAIDPKGGMELALGQSLFGKFVVDADEAADALEAAVAGMRARAKRLRGTTRKFTPQAGEDEHGGPLIVILVDEIASLVSPSYVPDAEIRKRITAALSILLSQGRAVGYSVVAAIQDPRKETLGFRDAFPTRIALRTAEAPTADLILGAGSRDRGARTDMISEETPGVGYAVVDDQPEPIRVRFAYMEDDEIRRRLQRQEVAA